ncbi:MAG: riboflavin biosynthesis protein RibF [Armatimonadia bacterium]|nr:riboflavin biosynthesis protein RibF [Armatimonadia bacterium]
MKTVRWSPDLELPNTPRVVALGAFDGVHLGHAKTIQAMRSIAHERGAEAAILTFDPSPREFTGGERKPGRRLTTRDEQCYYLRKLGVDLLVVFEFPGEIHVVEPNDFVRDILVKQVNAIHVTASKTHRFGHQGKGDVDLLRSLGDAHGFEVEIVKPLIVGDDRVSSTRIRNLLDAGQCHEAGALLGRPYAIYAPVVSGQGLGTKLGYPTANMSIPTEKILPHDGVYAGMCGQVHEGDYSSVDQPRPAAINVGLAPTVRGDERIVEVHMVEEQCDLTDATIKVEFLRWIRGEQKFEDTEALTEQIGRDVDEVLDATEAPQGEELEEFARVCATDYVVQRPSWE